MLVHLRLPGRTRKPIWWVSSLLLLAGIAAMLAGGWALLEGRLYQLIQKLQFESESAGTPDPQEGGAAVSTVAPPFAKPDRTKRWPFVPVMLKPDPLVIGELQVPRLGMNVLMREGVDETSLRKAAGHLPSSALPGGPGNFVVLGHRDTFFRPLRDIQPQDTIRIRTTKASYLYKVDFVQVTEPDWPGAVARTPDPVITLVTCFPFRYAGPAPRRFIVRAHLEP